MKELINTIKKNRLPKVVLELIDILNSSKCDTTPSYTIISHKLRRNIFDVFEYEGKIKPWTYNIHNYYTYTDGVFVSTTIYEPTIKYIQIAIENSKFSEYDIIW